MRKQIVGFMVVLSFGALISGGCAKKDMVKTEEPIPAVQPSTTAPQAETAKPGAEEAATPPPYEPAPVAETPTGETMGMQHEHEGMAKGAMALQDELQKIYFNFDSADLSAESRAALSKNADLLAGQPMVKVKVEGHTDERGSDEYNMALGERRAKAARDYLVNLGIAADRITVLSYGEEKPADPGHDEAAWEKNRRDEFVIVK